MDALLISGSWHPRMAILAPGGEVIWQVEQSKLDWVEVNDANYADGRLVAAIRRETASEVLCIRPDLSAGRGWETLWSYTVPHGAENHTCQILPGGDVLTAQIGADFVRLVELDANGREKKALGGPGAPLPGFEQRMPTSHDYLRTAFRTENGEYLLAHFCQGYTVRLDGQGQLLARYPAGGFTARQCADGRVLVSEGDSHGVSCFSPDGGLLWRVGPNDLPGCSIGFAADLRMLEDGSVLLANWNGHGGAKGAAVLRFDPLARQVLWRLDTADEPTISNIQCIKL